MAAGTSGPTSSPALSTFNYVDTSGKSQSFQAANAQDALANAPNIDPHSGVQMVTGAQSSTLPVVPGSPNTSGPSRTETDSNTSLLDQYLAQYAGAPTTQNPNPNPADGSAADNADTSGVPANDPFITALNSISTSSDAATKALIANTQAQYQQNVNKVNSQYDSYKAGLQQLGVETNEAQSTPDLLAGHILQAGNDQADKINTLQAAEQKAIMDANVAKANNDFKTLNAQMTYVKDLQTQKAQAIKDAYTMATNINKQVTFNAPVLYQQFSSLDPSDQQQFIEAVASSYGTSPMNVLSAIMTEQTKEGKANLATQNSEATLYNKQNPKSAGSKGGTDGTYSYTASDLATYNSLLKSGGTGPDGTTYAAQGSDGYVDPGAYLSVYNEWSSNGGTNKGFLAKFPLKMVNPASYSKLPSALLPKTKTAGAQTP